MAGDQAHLPASPAAARRRLIQGRRQARRLALEALYEIDLAHHTPADVLVRRGAALVADEDAVAYARELVAGVLQHRRELDDLIQQRAPAWPLSQMATVDRNLLRLSLYEALYRRDTVPLKVSISEAVELAKLYGSDSSPRFVNGVLGRVVETAVGEHGESTSPLDPTT